MSEKKDEGDPQNEFLSKNNQTTKKYPSETPRKNIYPKKQLHESKNNIETANSSLPAIATQFTREKSDLSESNEQKPSLLKQTAESLTENKTKLNLVEVAAIDENREKIRREDLSKEEIDDICGKNSGNGKTYTKTRTPGLDPRFQQQNQTLRCFVMYTDFYRCEKILGEGELACQWFKDVFTTICPLDWVRRWDEARETGVLPWMKSKTQGKFPGDRYGV